jgi:hypothetical protein
VHLAQQSALVRLQLFITGEVHRLLLEVMDKGAAALRKGSRDGAIDPVVVDQARRATLGAWGEFVDTYTAMLGAGIYTAAAFPFGSIAVMHRHLVLPTLEAGVAQPIEIPTIGGIPIAVDLWQMAVDQFTIANESRRRRLTEAEIPRAPDGVFKPQLDVIIKAVYKRVYDDGLTLSDRIWRMDQETRKGIDQVIYAALANGNSAWDTAEKLEKYLGAGKDCPRWTHERLFSLEKKDIASGDRTGLITGSECNGQGVSYNALRLARTEIQAAHHIANDMAFQKMPWVTEEQINLSPAHAEEDECDDVVGGGRDGKGIYPKGEIKLPLHPHCMCYKTAVLMDNTQFINDLRGWMTGSSQWPEMDEYTEMIGGNALVDLASNGIALLMDYWLWEAGEAVGALFWEIAKG